MATIIAKAGDRSWPAAGDFEPDPELLATGVEPVMLVAAGGRGERLDRFLAGALAERTEPLLVGLSRTRIQRWIALGAVHCDGRVLPAGARLSGLETIVIHPQPREADSAFGPEPVPLSFAWRDAALLVVDKPAGLVVHPAAGNWHGTLLNGLLHFDPALAALPRAGIVHRLDKDTSGLLVVGRTEQAMTSLAAQLADRSMERSYLALVTGSPPPAGSIDAPIGRDERVRVRMAAVDAARGRAALTRFATLARARLDARAVALLECRLVTGRTHQIRVHLAHAGFPLVGDSLYGGPALAGFARQALHAWRLCLEHPVERRRRAWVSPLPADMRELLGLAGLDASALPAAARVPHAGPERNGEPEQTR